MWAKIKHLTSSSWYDMRYLYQIKAKEFPNHLLVSNIFISEVRARLGQSDVPTTKNLSSL